MGRRLGWGREGKGREGSGWGLDVEKGQRIQGQGRQRQGKVTGARRLEGCQEVWQIQQTGQAFQ